MLYNLYETTASLVISLVAIISAAPIFSVMGLVLIALGGWWGQMYLKAQLPIQREKSNTRAPILGHLSATLSGLGKRPSRAIETLVHGTLTRTCSYDPSVWRARAFHTRILPEAQQLHPCHTHLLQPQQVLMP